MHTHSYNRNWSMIASWLVEWKRSLPESQVRSFSSLLVCASLVKFWFAGFLSFDPAFWQDNTTTSRHHCTHTDVHHRQTHKTQHTTRNFVSVVAVVVAVAVAVLPILLLMFRLDGCLVVWQFGACGCLLVACCLFSVVRCRCVVAFSWCCRRRCVLLCVCRVIGEILSLVRKRTTPKAFGNFVARLKLEEIDGRSPDIVSDDRLQALPCLVNSVKERDLSLFNSRQHDSHFIPPQMDFEPNALKIEAHMMHYELWRRCIFLNVRQFPHFILPNDVRSHTVEFFKKVRRTPAELARMSVRLGFFFFLRTDIREGRER